VDGIVSIPALHMQRSLRHPMNVLQQQWCLKQRSDSDRNASAVIESEAKQSISSHAERWIASSLCSSQ
jgi:hypothetical protein